MGGNRFATMLHGRTNRITVVLVYAVLEWVLILLLFMSCLFSYLIIKFAKFFGLKPPCPWCTRIDHIFDSEKGNRNLNRDLLCETHAKEVSRFGFCSIHSKLSESQGMCRDCFFSMPEFACFSRIKEFGITPIPNDDEMVGENGGEALLNCSCCGVSLLRRTLDGLVYPINESLVSEEGDHGDPDEKLSGFVADSQDCEKRMDNWLKELGEDKILVEKDEECVHVCEEESCANQHLEYFLDHTGHHLVPIEVVNIEAENAVLDSIVVEENQHENSLVFHSKDNILNQSGNLTAFPLEHWPSVDSNDAQEPSGAAVKAESEESEEAEAAHAHNENEAVVSIGTEIPDLDMNDEVPIKESLHVQERDQDDNVSESASERPESETQCPEQVEDRTVELRTLSVMDTASFLDNEEDKVPDTPASIDSFTQLHNKMMFLEKRDSWTEESFDESVTSEVDIADGVVTIESLKSALKAERKALKILYAEFEEERSASAVAASQTMAMINRLQEEKAAMQMEALQYQRMMEEQSEYDQDALQLMNELMVKRENEKQGLEKELAECQTKLFDYETKFSRGGEEKNSRNGLSSSSSINAEDREAGATSYNAVTETKESLSDFEDERMSYLEQLKGLEEKLFTMDDDANDTADAHMIINGSVDDTADSKHRKRIRYSSGHNGKSLLPLFDTTIVGNGDQTVQSNGVHNTQQQEEISHLYTRLEALESDKEFLKQCITSLQQGDKELVHEILHYLRDLQNVEIRGQTT